MPNKKSKQTLSKAKSALEQKTPLEKVKNTKKKSTSKPAASTSENLKQPTSDTGPARARIKLFISSREAALLFDTRVRNVQRKLTQIRKEYKIKARQPIPIHLFCQYLKLELETTLKILEVNDPGKR